MPVIHPISSLRNKTREIAGICRDNDEPVFLTTNGRGDLVVMSIAHYERLMARLSLFDKLAVAEAEFADGNRGMPHSRMIRKLKQRKNAS